MPQFYGAVNTSKNLPDRARLSAARLRAADADPAPAGHERTQCPLVVGAEAAETHALSGTLNGHSRWL